MSGKHRKIGSQAKKVAVVGVATATVTALTVGAAPPPPKPKPEPLVVNKNVDLMAAINPWPSPDQIPDLTAGLGTLGYDFSQAVAEVVIRAIVENFNLAALAQAAGLDPESFVESLLGDPNALLGGVLNGVLGEIPIDLAPALDDVLSLALGELVGPVVVDTILIPVLQALGITDAQGVTDLLSLLNLVGLDLSDPLNLAGLDVPGLNVITAGPAFTLLKLLGADLGWVPSLPNAVAREINQTDYLEVGVNGLLTTLLTKLSAQLPGNPLIPLLQGVIEDVTGNLPDVVHLRVPVTVGIGLGAFAIATGYDKVLADLPNQPGGVNYQGVDPVLGSFTVLPMLLLFNPARPNGGALARFYPLFGLLGIDTVNPETQASHSGGIPILNTGLSLGGANLVPVLIDAGIEYHPSSDLAAWPNPFSLANNLMAGVLPTYILRGLTLDTVTEQLTTQVEEALGNLAGGNPLALNLYLTIPSRTLPLLEPLYLAADVVNLATFGAFGPNVIERFANALAPALGALVNLGYTDVVRNPDGTYTRTLTEAGDPTPFFSFPSGINPVQVPFDVVNLLVKGFQKEFLSGNPTPGTPNAITGLLDLLGGGLGPLGDLGGLIQGILEGLNPLAAAQSATALASATSVPDDSAKMVTLSTDPDGDVATGKHAAPADAPVPEDTGAEPKHAAGEEEATQDVEEDIDTTEEETTEGTSTSSGSTTSPKPSTAPKPTTPRNPVGDVVGGAAHVVTSGVAGVLKSLAPKKPASTGTSTTTTKTDTDKDSAGGSTGGSSDSSSKDAA